MATTAGEPMTSPTRKDWLEFGVEAVLVTFLVGVLPAGVIGRRKMTDCSALSRRSRWCCKRDKAEKTSSPAPEALCRMNVFRSVGPGGAWVVGSIIAPQVAVARASAAHGNHAARQSCFYGTRRQKGLPRSGAPSAASYASTKSLPSRWRCPAESQRRSHWREHTRYRRPSQLRFRL